jgi:succinyl-diaminopimelate desuccinylase
MWNPETLDRIASRLVAFEPAMVRMQEALVARPAVSPASGGDGERARVEYLRPLLEGWGLAVTEYRAPDPAAPCGYRPSLVARLAGRDRSRTLWVMTHLDVVPAGPRELWATDPHTAVVAGGRIYGRGVEDNQQEMVASAFAVRVLLDLGLVPEFDVALMLVADEEVGSKFGVDWLLAGRDLCGPGDLVVVPDAGNAEGTMLEVAEKSIAWVRFRVTGGQAHASMPGLGRNAHRAGAAMIGAVDRALHERFPAADRLYSPPESTFEPTKKEANVPNVNTIPGEDVFHFDCRVLPQYRLDDVLSVMREAAERVAGEQGVAVELATSQYLQAPPPTSPGAPVVRMLARAVREVLGCEAAPAGIGGGTVASFFRRQGIPTVVWGRSTGSAHQPNEFCIIASMRENALVYAHLFGQLLPEQDPQAGC